MREIKFRAWDERTKNMIYPKYVTEGEEHHHIRIFPDGTGGIWDDDFEKYIAQWGLDDKDQLMQYTGLKDKNNKEIYEGDIVKYKSLTGFECDSEDYKQSKEITERKERIIFINGAFHPREQFQDVDDGYYSSRDFDFEVIGNIYENKELVEVVDASTK